MKRKTIATLRVTKEQAEVLLPKFQEMLAQYNHRIDNNNVQFDNPSDGAAFYKGLETAQANVSELLDVIHT